MSNKKHSKKNKKQKKILNSEQNSPKLTHEEVQKKPKNTDRVEKSMAMVPVDQVQKIVETAFSKKLEEVIHLEESKKKNLFGRAIIYLQAPKIKLSDFLSEKKELLLEISKKSGILVLVSIIGGTGLVLFDLAMAGKTLPGIRLDSQKFSYLPGAEAKQNITNFLNAYFSQKVAISFGDQKKELSLEDLGISLQMEETLKKLPVYSFHNDTPLSFLLSLIKVRQLQPDIIINQEKLLSVLEKEFSLPDLRAKNARFEFDQKEKTVKIIAHSDGQMINGIVLQKNLEDQIYSYQDLSLNLPMQEEKPQVKTDELEKFKAEIILKLENQIALNHGEKNWKVKFIELLQTIDFSPKNDGLQIVVKDSFFDTEFYKKISSEIEKPTQNVKIFHDQEDKIIFEGTASDGVEIDKQALLNELTNSLNIMSSNVEIISKVSRAKVEVDQKLADLGIKELIGTGHTTFAGSTPNRRHNIKVASEKYNGIILAPGEVFSFNDTLGQVDGQSGYKLELVIKSTGTVPEYGGGVCQISSTVFKSALFSGLPIVERYPHSYAVGYYAQVDGHGLDSTIYPGIKDLKFSNDTPAHILLQSYIDGDNAFVKVYGTSDGRQVRLENYRRFNFRGAGGTERIPTKTLPTGVTKQIEKANSGFDASWDRVIIKDGKETKENIYSVYRSTANRVLVGE